jgi:hypothetical protein
MPADLPGLGTILECKPVTTAAYVAIPQVQTIEPSGMEVGERNPTHLGSTIVQKKPIILNGGELAVTIFFDPNDSVHRYLFTACTAKSTGQSFKMKYLDGNATAAYLEVLGYVKSFEQGGFEVEGTVEATATIAITSIASFASGS